VDRLQELEAKIAELEARLAKLEGRQGKPSEVEALVELGRKLAREKAIETEGYIPPSWQDKRDRPIR